MDKIPVFLTSPDLAYFQSRIFPKLEKVLAEFIEKNDLSKIKDILDTTRGKIVTLDDSVSRFIIYSKTAEPISGERMLKPSIGGTDEMYDCSEQIYGLEGFVRDKKEALFARISEYQFYKLEKNGIFGRKYVKSGEPRGVKTREDASGLFFIIDAPIRVF